MGRKLWNADKENKDIKAQRKKRGGEKPKKRANESIYRIFMLNIYCIYALIFCIKTKMKR